MVDETLAIDGGSPVIDAPLANGVSGPSVVGEEEVAAVTEVLRGQRLFRYNEDSQSMAFEKEAAEFLGVEYALMVNSGTSALVCAMIGAGIGPGDEVIIPGYTYIATTGAVISAGAVPVIAEIRW